MLEGLNKVWRVSERRKDENEDLLSNCLAYPLDSPLDSPIPNFQNYHEKLKRKILTRNHPLTSKDEAIVYPIYSMVAIIPMRVICATLEEEKGKNKEYSIFIRF